MSSLADAEKLIPSANKYPNAYQTEKHPSMKLIFSYMYKDYSYKHVTDSNKKFLGLAIPKSWKYTVLVEAHDKLGHQGTTCTYCLIKCQYYWKGMNKDIRIFIANCTLCHREKANVQPTLFR